MFFGQINAQIKNKGHSPKAFFEATSVINPKTPIFKFTIFEKWALLAKSAPKTFDQIKL